MVKLTEREAEVVRLRDEEDLSWNAIADVLGSSKSSVNSSYRNATNKKNRPPNSFSQAIEVKDPEKAAEVLDVATDPFMTIRAAAKECGFPKSTLHQLMKRIEARYKPLGDAIRTLKNDEMIKLLEDRARRAFEYLDDFALSTASAKDLAIAGGVMIDKARLLKEQSTQIITVKDRRNMDELGAALIKEFARRNTLPRDDPLTIGMEDKQDIPTSVSVDKIGGGNGKDDGDGSVGGMDTVK